jgi:hypothetical protein
MKDRSGNPLCNEVKQRLQRMSLTRIFRGACQKKTFMYVDKLLVWLANEFSICMIK